MTNNKRRLIEGWIDKASNQLQAAEQHSKSYIQYSEAIQAQECIELSVKSVLSLFDITFSPSHGWERDKKQFASIAEQIQNKQLIDKLT
jgi:HEPN domain-containing protein